MHKWVSLVHYTLMIFHILLKFSIPPFVSSSSYICAKNVALAQVYASTNFPFIPSSCLFWFCVLTGFFHGWEYTAQLGLFRIDPVRSSGPFPIKILFFPRPSPIWWMEPLTFSVSYIYYTPSSSPLQLVYWWFLVLLLLYLLFVIKYVVQCYEVSLKSLFRYFLCDYLYICFLWFWVHTCEGACLWRYDVALLFPV